MELVGSTELPGLGTLRFFRAARCGSILAPGQELFGTIEFHCLKASMFVRGVWVKLTGRQCLSVGSTRTTQLDLLEGQEDYYLGGFHDVLYGFGEEDESGGALFEIHEGVHRWNFAFKIPENAPPSYCDEYMDVSYTATVVFDSPEVPIAISQLTHTAVVTASVLDATSSRILAAANSGDIEALGMRPSVAFQNKKQGSAFWWGCMQPDSSVSSATSDDVVAILDAAPARPVTSLERTNSRNGSGSGSRHSTHGAHTVLRLMLSKDEHNFAPSSSGTTAPMPVAFDFTFMETAVKVDCNVATMCTGKICLEARLIVCINLRSDPTRPFRSLRSLLRAPSTPAVASTSSAGPDVKADSGLRMHVLHSLPKGHAAKGSKDRGVSGAVRRWLGMSSPVDSEDGEGLSAEGWGACIVHPLWSRVVVLQAPEQPLAPVTVQLQVPVKIDPTVRSTCLADWPRPSPLLHGAHGAILNFTTRDTPLFQYRVLLEVAAYELKGDAGTPCPERGTATPVGLEKSSVKKQLLCQPVYAEVEINAPGPSRPDSAAPAGVRRCRRAPGPFSPIQASAPVPAPAPTASAVAPQVAPGVGLPEVVTAATSSSSSQPFPRPRHHRSSTGSRRAVAPSHCTAAPGGSSGTDSLAAGNSLGIAGGGVAMSTSTTSTSVAPLDGHGVAPSAASHEGVPSNTNSAAETEAGVVEVALPGRPRRRRQRSSEAARPSDVVSDENSDPNRIVVVNSKAGKHKPQTPQACAVKCVPKVKAELVSRGPAAVLRDRTAPVHRDIQITPQRFAPAMPIAQGAVVVLDDTTSMAMGDTRSTATDRPTSARATTVAVSASTPDAEYRGLGTGGESPGFSPSQLMSPALAFLCSPRTTEMLLQQEAAEQAREDEEMAAQERAAGGDGSCGEQSGDDDDASSRWSNSYAGGDGDGEVIETAEVTLDDLPRRPPLAALSTAAVRSAIGASAGVAEGTGTGTPFAAGSRTPLTRLGLVLGQGEDGDGVHPFQLPPDTAPPSARVSNDVGGNTIRGSSPWVDSGAAGVGIHFTQNGRRLSFSHPTEDLVSEFQPLPFNSPIPT